jgi:hypothetical protein
MCLAEDDEDALGTAPQRRCGAVEGGVAGAQDDDHAVQRRKASLAAARSTSEGGGDLKTEVNYYQREELSVSDVVISFAVSAGTL